MQLPLCCRHLVVAVQYVTTDHLLAVGTVGTIRAREGLFTSVRSHVALQQPLPAELVATDKTLGLLGLFLVASLRVWWPPSQQQVIQCDL